jgi:hypothetical protein
LAAGLVAAFMPGGAEANSGGAVQAATATVSCDAWHPGTPEQRTSNGLLGVYLQKQNCDNGTTAFKVAIHNYSPSGVGSRAYGLWECRNGGRVAQLDIYTGVYIPAGGAWASSAYVVVAPTAVSGVIYRPRTSTDQIFTVEVGTICVS